MMSLTPLIRAAINSRCLLPEQEACIAKELERRAIQDIDEVELAALSLLEALIANGTVRYRCTAL